MLASNSYLPILGNDGNLISAKDLIMINKVNQPQMARGFEFKAFPASAQVAPLFGLTAFSAGNNKGVLAGANFSGVLPYEGKYDADYGDVMLLNNKKELINSSAVSSGFYSEMKFGTLKL